MVIERENFKFYTSVCVHFKMCNAWFSGMSQNIFKQEVSQYAIENPLLHVTLREGYQTGSLEKTDFSQIARVVDDK